MCFTPHFIITASFLNIRCWSLCVMSLSRRFSTGHSFTCMFCSVLRTQDLLEKMCQTANRRVQTLHKRTLWCTDSQSQCTFILSFRYGRFLNTRCWGLPHVFLSILSKLWLSLRCQKSFEVTPPRGSAAKHMQHDVTTQRCWFDSE